MYAMQLYTVGRKKRATVFWTITAMFPGGFLHFLYQWKQEWILYKIYNFTLTVSPHYLIKLKPHKTAHFEVSRHSILLLNSKNESMS